ncbi:MAG: DUF4169 family protein [Pseudomonadota bacterium]
MSDAPINLNKARKARARAAKKARADQNAVVHGLPKSAKTRAQRETSRMARAHDEKALSSPAQGAGKGLQKP